MKRKFDDPDIVVLEIILIKNYKLRKKEIAVKIEMKGKEQGVSMSSLKS